MKKIDLEMSNKIYLTDILPNRFYFGTFSHFIPQSDATNLYIIVDSLLMYPNINSYFGPPSLSDIYKYCTLMKALIQDNANPSQRIVHLAQYEDAKKSTNAIFLIGTFLIMVHNISPSVVIKKLKSIKNVNLTTFCDTTSIKSAPTLRMKYFFDALLKARSFGWFTLSTFDVDEYDRLNCPEGGDMNWILPGKFLAFSDPFGRIGLGFVDIYINYFRANNITTIIRCNEPKYDAQVFQQRGIIHHDLYFDDGTAPSQFIIEKFLYIAEATHGALAIHCKAGLGRTGTLIAAYIIKHYYVFNALEVTAWARLCRPGSIIGFQQHFLEVNELWLKEHNSRFKGRRKYEFDHNAIDNELF